MRRVLYLSLFLFACAIPALAQDPVKVDPQHYKVEFENANVRVLRVKVGAGEKSMRHMTNACGLRATECARRG